MQGKFKPAKSMPTKSSASASLSLGLSRPAKFLIFPNPKVSKLGSFSTPGFGKVKPKPLEFTTADNGSPYVNVSSTESTPLNVSTSSIPIKRFSSGSSEDFPPHTSPKRPKTTHHPPDKENVFLEVDVSGKGKGRAQDSGPPSSTLHVVVPSHTAQASPSVPTFSSRSAGTGPKALPGMFEKLPHDVGLHEV